MKIERSPGGGDAVRAVPCLPALTGAWRRPGGGTVEMPIYEFPMSIAHMCRPDWIKPGTRDGQRIRLAGRGNAGINGGANGDLFLIIKIGSHPVFTRTADDIYAAIPVTLMEAALGAKIDVPTVDTYEGGGRTQLKIPPGTQTGQKLRLREKGVASATQEGHRGDQIVEVKVVVPKVQDERSKEILRELAKLNPEDPRAGMLDAV